MFGPMAEIGWGSPPIITAQIGIVLELPMPIKLAILGRIIRGAARRGRGGREDPPRRPSGSSSSRSRACRSTLRSTTRRSWPTRSRATWRCASIGAQQPTFALSVGGLHPRSSSRRPASPRSRRLSLTMGDGENPRLACETYIAITANSAQFGAHLEAKVSAGGYGVHGYLGFDVLFIFSPFSMTAEMNAGRRPAPAATRVLMTISLSFTLTGPSPWHACGTATAHILFFDVSVAVRQAVGRPVQVLLAALNALQAADRRPRRSRQLERDRPERGRALRHARLEPRSRTERSWSTRWGG